MRPAQVRGHGRCWVQVQMHNGTPHLVEALQRARVFPDPEREVRGVETHISWIVLTGGYA